MTDSSRIVWDIQQLESGKQGSGITTQQIGRWLEEYRLLGTDRVRRAGDTAWVEIENVPELTELIPLPPTARAGATEEDLEVDLTPMIDVTFLLIIFFMITATFAIQKTLDLAVAEQEEAPDEPIPMTKTVASVRNESISIVVDVDGNVQVEGNPAPLESLPDTLRELSESTGKTEALVQAAAAARHEVVMNVVDAANLAKLEPIHFVAPATSP